MHIVYSSLIITKLQARRQRLAGKSVLVNHRVEAGIVWGVLESTYGHPGPRVQVYPIKLIRKDDGSPK